MMPRAGLFFVLVVFGALATSCGDERVETSSRPGSLVDGDQSGGAENPPLQGEETEDGASSDGSAGIPEFYENYRMAVDPLFQQAPDLVGTSYAFSWLDHESETVVVSATEPVPDGTRASLAELIPAELPIEYRIVDNTAAELEATHQILSQNLDAIGPVTSFGTSPIDNKVQVHTADVDDTMTRLQELGVELSTVDVQPGSGTPASEAQPGGVDGPVLYSGSSDGHELDAEVRGSVVFEGSCIYLTNAPDFPEIRSLVVWPLGTTWQHDPPAVVLPGGDRVEPGDFVEGGGGYLKFDTVEPVAGPAGQDLVNACREGTDGNVAVFNKESTVELIGN